jgi:hypothetical protein
LVSASAIRASLGSAAASVIKFVAVSGKIRPEKHGKVTKFVAFRSLGEKDTSAE